MVDLTKTTEDKPQHREEPAIEAILSSFSDRASARLMHRSRSWHQGDPTPTEHKQRLCIGVESGCHDVIGPVPSVVLDET